MLAERNSQDVDTFRQLACLGDGVRRHDDILEIAIGELDNMVRSCWSALMGRKRLSPTPNSPASTTGNSPCAAVPTGKYRRWGITATARDSTRYLYLFGFSGAGSRVRTRDPLITNQVVRIVLATPAPAS